jgi:rhodanese-related sulfurtransferase
MNFLRNLFLRKTKQLETTRPAPEAIPPARFRKEEFNFAGFQDLSPAQAAQKIDRCEVQVLDVRYEYEYRHHRIPSAKLIPLPQLPSLYHELDPAQPILVVCEHGMRSLRACSFLSSKGFKTLYNMTGGMSVYPGKQEGDTLPK